MYMDAFSKDMLDMGGCLSAAKATAATAAAQKQDPDQAVAVVTAASVIKASAAKPPHPQPQLQPQLPPLLSHPQPQLVAAKSLMVMSSEIFYTLHHMRGSLPQFP